MGRRLKIATYNIHGWVDEECRSNLDRVAELVNLHDPDILCLQEVTSSPSSPCSPAQVYPCWEQPCLLEFLRKTGFEFSLRWEGCAILSKAGIVLQEHGAEEDHSLLPKAPGFDFNRPRYLTARVQVEDCQHFFITCIHLIPKYSELRHEEVVQISEDLRSLFRLEQPQVWVGDFNTLREADYSQEEWRDIVSLRQKNGRKAPLSDVTEELDRLGLQDNWTLAGRPEPRTTSR